MDGGGDSWFMSNIIIASYWNSKEIHSRATSHVNSNYKNVNKEGTNKMHILSESPKTLINYQINFTGREL